MSCDWLVKRERPTCEMQVGRAHFTIYRCESSGSLPWVGRGRAFSKGTRGPTCGLRRASPAYLGRFDRDLQSHRLHPAVDWGCWGGR